jgi:signal transduction histidine kinase
MSAAFTSLVSRVVVTRTTVRWRLTLLYGGMFVACGAALLPITYTLVDHATVTRTILQHARPPTTPRPRPVHSAPPLPRSTQAFAIYVTHQQRINDLHQLVIWSAIALAVMAVASMLLGWIIAGRVLAPLRKITATTQQISAGNLHERLAIAGPRDELTQLAGTIDGLLERLDGSFEAQRRFVANASHELRTPLAMMRTFLDVAVAKPDGVPQQTRALDADLRRALDHADRLLESFFVPAQAQHGELGEQHSVELEQLVTGAIRARTRQIVANGIDVRTALHPVRAVAQLAQPFKRRDRDRTGSQNGHGLRLSIIAAVAGAHNGTRELHARPQGGLRVEITLPDATATQPTRVTR